MNSVGTAREIAYLSSERVEILWMIAVKSGGDVNLKVKAQGWARDSGGKEDDDVQIDKS